MTDRSGAASDPGGARRLTPGAEEALRVLTALFVAVLVTSNFIAAKLVTIAGFTVPAAVIVFPVSYILGDVLTEVYGYAVARRVIWTGFIANVVVVAIARLSIEMPSSPYWTLGSFGTADAAQDAYAAVLGAGPRIVLASLLAYLVGEFLNAGVMSRLKVATSGRFLWVRTIGSTLVGQFADSGVFITVAFVGLVPGDVLRAMVLAQWLVKCAFEALATPVTYLAVARLKRLVGFDRFDRGVDLNPVRW